MTDKKTDKILSGVRGFFGFNPDKFKRILFYTTFFWAVAHGYRFLNNLHTGDTLSSVFQDDIVWQRSLGRFMQPLTLILRGTIVAPWLLFVISVFLFTVATLIVTDILKIERPVLLFFTCGILTCNSTLTCANAVFTPWIDIYGVAFLLVSLGVWFFLKDKWWCYALGILSFIVAMGFYQCYIDVAFVLFLIVIVGDLTERKTFKEMLLKVVKIVGGLAIAGIGYYISFKTVIKVHHSFEATSYNGISGVLDYDGQSLPELFAGSYTNFFHYLMNPGTFASTILKGEKVSNSWALAIKIFVVLAIALIVAGMVIVNKKNKPHTWEKVLQAVMLLLFPPVANFIYIIAKGFEYELMVYSFLFLFVFLLYLAERTEVTEKPGLKTCVAVVPLVVLIWNNVVYSNQAYFKVEMQDRAALAYATRLVYDIEHTEGYKTGDTSVLFVGFPTTSDKIDYPAYLSEVYVPSNYKTAFTYQSSLGFYIRNYLAVNMNIMEMNEFPPEIDEMPEYPEKGSIRFIGDYLAVKISDPYK